ncbi:glycosyltransferase family 2 protein [Halobacillus sp. K22]|uniref:glycosyltransferase family 2 protein n=1 Tax=Halobacillus sp. K22 TaxID=3457431 RepID=UPI003FCD3D5B
MVPVFNVEKYLSKCIESILAQKFTNFELILVNDGSKDRSGTICDHYASHNKKVKVFHTENRGQAAARNLGLRKASGEYIGFVDSDDWIESNMFSLLYKQSSKNKSDISIIGIREIDENGRQLSEYIPKEITFRDILQRAYPCNKLFKKELFINNNLYFKEGRYYEDLNLIAKLYIKSNHISLIDEISYNYLKRSDSTTSTRDNRILDNLWAYTEIKNYLINEGLYKEFGKEFEEGIKYFRVYYIKLLYDYPTSFFFKNAFRFIKDFEKIGGFGNLNYIKLFNKHIIYCFYKSCFRIKKYTFKILR